MFMCRRLIVVFFLICVGLSAFGQSIDERIASAMNDSRWADLRRLYVAEGGDVQAEFLHPLSRFFISHFYNQPDTAVNYGTMLLRQYQDDLGGSVSSVVYLLATDYARQGKYGEAASLLHKLNEAALQSGVSAPFLSAERRYHIVDSLGGFTVSKPDHDVCVPLKFYRDYPKDPVMLYVYAGINGIKKFVTFDTGAGENVISRDMAKRVGARLFDTDGNSVHGIRNVATEFAVVDSIRLGEVVFRNITFHVVDFTTESDKANQKIKDLDWSMAIGSQMMLPMGELQFDFDRRQLLIPAVPSAGPAYAPNFYYSQDNQILLSVMDRLGGKEIIANFDTGSSSTELSTRYYLRNRTLFDDVTPTDTIHQAGIGSMATFKAIKLRWNYEIGDARNLCDSVYLKIPEAEEAIPYDAVIGLPSLAPRSRLILNFNDMWIKIEE